MRYNNTAKIVYLLTMIKTQRAMSFLLLIRAQEPASTAKFTSIVTPPMNTDAAVSHEKKPANTVTSAIKAS